MLFAKNLPNNLTAPKARLLIQAGADPTLAMKDGLTCLPWIRRHRPSDHAAIAFLEEILAEGEKTALLAKARRLAIAAADSHNAVTPTYRQKRMALGQPLPQVALVSLTVGQDDEEGEGEGEESRKLRSALAFMCGLGRQGMPRDVFGVVMALLMPSWDPLRRKNANTEPSAAVQGEARDRK
jgi:hypothetical protein